MKCAKCYCMREMQTSVAYSRITVRNSCAATLYTHQIGKALGCIVFVYSIGTEVKYANDIHVSLKYIMQFVQVSFFFLFCAKDGEVWMQGMQSPPAFNAGPCM